MGYLLSIVLTLPLTNSDIELNMWFSRESYCTLAIEKFTEKPFLHTLPDGTSASGEIRSADCRELSKDEATLVPDHLKWKVEGIGSLFN